MASGKIGFIGLGVMGTPMSKRLLERGHDLVVHDRDREAVRRLTAAGAAEAASAREVANAAQTVFVSLPTPAIVREVALGEDGVVRGRRGAHVRRPVDHRLDRRTGSGGRARPRARHRGGRRAGLRRRGRRAEGHARGDGRGHGREAVAGVRPLLEVFGKVFVVGDRAGAGRSS